MVLLYCISILYVRGIVLLWALFIPDDLFHLYEFYNYQCSVFPPMQTNSNLFFPGTSILIAAFTNVPKSLTQTGVML